MGRRLTGTIAIKVVILLIWIILPGSARAGKAISYSFKIQEDYNDNIHLSSTDEKEDLITRLIGSVAFKRPARWYDLSLSYTFEGRFYRKHTSSNSDRHTFDLDLHSMLMRDLFYVDLKERFEKVPIDVRLPVSPTDEVDVNLVDRNTFLIKPYISTDIHYGRIKAGYSFEAVEYSDEKGIADSEVYSTIDSRSHSLFVSLERQILTRLLASLGYTFTARDADQERSDYRLHSIFLKALYTPTSLTELTIMFGRDIFDYETIRDRESTVWALSLVRKLKGKGSISINARQDFEDSATEGAYRSRSLSAGLTYGRKVALSGRAFIREDDYTEVEREDRSRGLEAGLSWQAMPQIGLFLKGSIERDRFSNPAGKARIKRAEFGLNYSIRPWLNLGARYMHTERASDRYRSYINNIYSIWLEAAF